MRPRPHLFVSPAAVEEFDLAGVDVMARRALPAAPARVFEFLADLHNHWLLQDRFVELGGLDGDEGSTPLGGQVRLKGPVGIRREARTRALSARPPGQGVPERLLGRADVGTGTTGRISWEIDGDGDGSVATLAAVVERASLLDRVLLLLGRWWLQRTFDQALVNLDRILTVAAPAPVAGSMPHPRAGKRQAQC